MSPTMQSPAAGVLVAGIGNVFLGDDAFGVEVARRLARRPLPAGVTVQDFGIRGFDLAFALRDYDAAVLVDTIPLQDGPGTIHLIDASEVEAAPVAAEAHGMHPARVLAFARALGPMPETILVLGCEPAVLPDPLGVEIVRGLSPPVLAAVDEAVRQLETLVGRLKQVGGTSEGRTAGKAEGSTKVGKDEGEDEGKGHRRDPRKRNRGRDACRKTRARTKETAP